jgi:predicted RNA binding protein YcfA (HicA-like mRNA interferase family)
MARMAQVSARELVRFLKAQGFVEDRQSGSHLTLRHGTRKVTVTVPMTHGSSPCASSRTRGSK